ncbi:MAG: zinc ABC transporter substrate-binding protein [Candidatus Azobacteroides sp.]|nr:zinc ABC transporter substrate-binding protein [Candidatus Azobacteroides sp.]
MRYGYFFSLAIGILFSCTGKVQQENRITVTIEPQRYFAEQLAHPFFEVVALVPPGTSPETYDPTPQQMAFLAKSKAYFCIGHIGFERAWLNKLKQTNPQLSFFDNSEGIEPIVSESPLHDSPNRLEEGIDPHTWTSPKQALKIAENMHKALAVIDAEHRSAYRENFEKLSREINATDQKVESYLRSSSQKAFIIYHPALTYFARDYGLIQYAIEAEGKEPSPEQLKHLVDRAKKENIRTVFVQQEFDQKNAEIIARETGCRLVEINPLSYRWSEEILRIAKALSDE